MLVYKIFRGPEWEAFRAAGLTDGAPVDVADGFIHFSGAGTVRETAAKWFAGAEGLVLAACDAEALGDDLRWEPSRGGVLFPHLYRRLALPEVVWSGDLPLADGAHVFPDGIP